MAKNNINAVSDSDTKTGAEAPENVTVSKSPHSSEKEKNPEKAKAEAAPQNKSAVFAYIGPNIRGVITNGTIFTGKKDEIVNEIKTRADVAGQSAKMPKIAQLIVADVNISKAKAQLKAGGNALSEAYKAILAED